MKKLIALLLAVIMMFSLVACGGGAQEEVDQLDYNPDAQWAGIYTDPQWDGSLPLVQEGEDNVITYGMISNVNVVDYDTNEYTLWLEEQTGIDLQFIYMGSSAADASTQFNLMAASGEELPDIVSLSSMSKENMKQFGRDGYLLNLSGYLETDAYYLRQALELYYGDRYDWIENHIFDTVGDPGTGAMYAWPQVFQNSVDVITCQPWINQDWLDNLGLEAPTNIDELYNVLVAFRDNDPNGNGLKDEIPMLGKDASQSIDLIGWIINAYIYYNYKHRFNVENDVVYAPFNQDEYREALIFIKKLVDEGLLSPMTWSASSTERKALLCPSDNVFTVGITAATYDEGFVNGHDAMYNYTPLAPLADQTGRGGYASISADKVMYVGKITCDCDNPRLAFRLLDFMSSPEAYLRGRWGVQGVDWDYLPEDGTLTGALGGVPRLVLHGDDPTNYVNNQCWGGAISQTGRDYWQFAQDFTDGSWKSEQYRKAQMFLKNAEEAAKPDQIFYEMCRNDEEDAIYNECHNDLLNYVKTARAEFCNGIRNPESDADWQKYLDDLAGLKFQEAWIDVAQASWDRQQARN